MLGEEHTQRYRRRFGSTSGATKMQHGFAEPCSDRERESRAALRIGSDAEHGGGVAIADVPLRALGILARRRFAQIIAVGQRTVLRLPASRAPAAVREAMRDREIECRAIGSGLPARDDRDRARVCHKWLTS